MSDCYFLMLDFFKQFFKDFEEYGVSKIKRSMSEPIFKRNTSPPSDWIQMNNLNGEEEEESSLDEEWVPVVNEKIIKRAPAKIKTSLDELAKNSTIR